MTASALDTDDATLAALPRYGGRVMVIDDEPDALRVILGLLRHYGLELACAQTYGLGLHNAPLVRPDLILLDIGLPDGDGLALCAALRADPRTREVPVILLTARADLDAKRAAFQAGAVDYITKPCVAAEVLLRVVNHLGQVARTRALLRRLRCYEPAPVSPVADWPPPLPALAPDTPAAELRVLLRARDRLLATLVEPPSLEALARYAGSNRTSLGRLFRKHLGMSVFDYLREQRLQMARRLLDDSELSLSRVAALVGYAHGRDLGHAFRRRFGLTPGDYRVGRQQSAAG